MGFFDFLSRPPWDHSDPRVRLAAVRALTDQKILAKIAGKDFDGFIRIAAADRLTDPILTQFFLETIAAKDPNQIVRFTAAKRILNKALAQSIFTDIAATGEVCWLRFAAAKRITDETLAQNFFKTMAENKGFNYSAVRKSAARLLKDKTLARSILADKRLKKPLKSKTKKTTEASIQICPNRNIAMSSEDGNLDFPVEHVYCKTCANRDLTKPQLTSTVSEKSKTPIVEKTKQERAVH
jgi:Pyruvate/2-oxoacid:ferredoxin oxidoreductase delta subunit